MLINVFYYSSCAGSVGAAHINAQQHVLRSNIEFLFYMIIVKFSQLHRMLQEHNHIDISYCQYTLPYLQYPLGSRPGSNLQTTSPYLEMSAVPGNLPIFIHFSSPKRDAATKQPHKKHIPGLEGHATLAFFNGESTAFFGHKVFFLNLGNAK